MALLNSKQFLSAALVAAAPLSALAASADVTTVSDPESGFQVGSARVNPTLELELRSDSVASYDDKGTAVSDTILHVRPGLRFKAPSESLELTFRGNYDYNAYLATPEGTPDLDRSGWDIDFNALANKAGAVRFDLGDRFVRSDRTSNLSLGVDNISNRNDLAARLQFVGAGENWTIAPGYTLTTESFESVIGGDDQDRLAERYDYMAHTARLEGRYKVFGQSAILLDGSYTARTYTADPVTIGERTYEVAPDSNSLRLVTGLTGMLSPKLGYTARIGLGTQSVDADGIDGYSGALGGVELNWFANAFSQVRLGYGRSFEADPAFAFYSDDRIYLDAGTMLGSKLGVKAGVAYDMLTFGEIPETDKRDGSVLSLHVGPEYAFNRFFSAGLKYALTSRAMDSEAYRNTVYEYDRHEFGARVSVIY